MNLRGVTVKNAVASDTDGEVQAASVSALNGATVDSRKIIESAISNDIAVLAGKLKVDRELASDEKLSVIHLVSGVIEYAYAMRASDVHLDPGPKHIRVRFRVDGILQDVYEIPNAVHVEVISRVKILAGMRTDEHQSAQDGRFRASVESGETIDVRVSVVPTYYGENVVLRLLTRPFAQ